MTKKIKEHFPFVDCRECQKCILKVKNSMTDASVTVSCRNDKKCVEEIKNGLWRAGNVKSI